MQKLLVPMVLSLAAWSALADTVCTTEPQTKWMKEADFLKQVAKQGYKVNKFEKDSTCYEVEGLNKSGQKVEVKFNPVTARVVKEELED